MDWRTPTVCASQVFAVPLFKILIKVHAYDGVASKMVPIRKPLMHLEAWAVFCY